MSEGGKRKTSEGGKRKDENTKYRLGSHFAKAHNLEGEFHVCRSIMC